MELHVLTQSSSYLDAGLVSMELHVLTQNSSYLDVGLVLFASFLAWSNEWLATSCDGGMGHWMDPGEHLEEGGYTTL